MSAATVPIQVCDHEDGCDQWVIDLESTGAHYLNGDSPLNGWWIDRMGDAAFCPEHAAVKEP